MSKAPLSPITTTCPKDRAGFTFTAAQVCTMANALHDFYAAMDTSEDAAEIFVKWKAQEPEVNAIFQSLCNAALSLDAAAKAEKE